MLLIHLRYLTFFSSRKPVKGSRVVDTTLYVKYFLFQVQALKVLVNLSSNPDMMDDIVQAQVRLRG